MTASLAEVWQRRDRLQDRALSRAGWTPVDYAPHLWREYQELALGIDRRSRAGAAFDPASLANDIARNLSLDEKLFSDSAGPPADRAPQPQASTRAQTVASRLMEARKQFLNRMQSDSYFAADANPLRDAIQWKNDLVFRAPYYVRWNVAASRTSSGTWPAGPGARQAAPFVGRAHRSAGAVACGGSPAAAEQIADNVEALKDSYRRIEQMIDDKVKALEQHPDLTAIDALLDTPLLAAPGRKRLLAARDRVADALPGDLPKKTLRPPSLGLWSTSIRQQAELERQLARWRTRNSALPAWTTRLRTPATTLTDSQFWKTYRQFGQELGGFYRGLPESIRKELGSGDSSAGNRCDRYLRLVDARDAASVPDEVLNVVLPHPRTAPAGAQPCDSGRVAAGGRRGWPVHHQAIGRQDGPAGNVWPDHLRIPRPAISS